MSDEITRERLEALENFAAGCVSADFYPRTFREVLSLITALRAAWEREEQAAECIKLQSELIAAQGEFVSCLCRRAGIEPVEQPISAENAYDDTNEG
jgi:hypothetical protein